jgi:hypothetical protein
LCDKIKEDVMGRAQIWRDDKFMKKSGRESRRKEIVAELVAGSESNVKMIFEELVKMWTGFNWLSTITVVDCCERLTLTCN